MTQKTHVVKRAIIMAAGKGNRMRPLTDKIPKPLVSVNGTRMIDSVISALHANGIHEIYVVVGYLKEQFMGLPEQYPGLSIIENPYFDTCNNISSLYVARKYLEDCIILDGDQIINNPVVLTPEFTISGYNATWSEGETDEWLMKVENNVVVSCSDTGGKKGWQLYSISRWSKEDGEKLKSLLEYEFDRGNRQIYWDDVPMILHLKEFKLGIHEMKPGDVIEIDGILELASIDKRYVSYIS